MIGTETMTLATAKCPKCGAALLVSGGLCPKCLLKTALSTWAGDGPSETDVLPEHTAENPLRQSEGNRAGSAARRQSKGLPAIGEQFGHYHMLRLLGQGGMGVVYEAEDLETGRRVALKILGQALDSPDARKRFLREGQLAGSINHPNSIYVFGTEEIAGTPVIAMELVSGGTLREKIVASGPMPHAQAVDCALQLIAGLQAAQQIGILHRDIKPSNCFIDSDGTVKIGDFGLSISSAVRTESNLTEAETLFGTPAFSSPEQLRGDELSVRSDIYSVGVTIYYLLTGRIPFEAENMVQLLATVLEKKPDSPAKWQPNIPKALTRTILRCMEKDAGERFASYAELSAALAPYASTARAVPGKPGLRFLAGCFDLTFLTTIAFQTSKFAANRDWKSTLVFWAIIAGYFSMLEGIWGASLGKMIFRLRVVRIGRNPPGLMWAFLRTVSFLGMTLFASDMIFALFIPESENFGVIGVFILLVFVLIGLHFSAARKRNGFAGLHELISGTRVISTAVGVSRPALTTSVPETPGTTATPQIGPYYLLEPDGGNVRPVVLLAFDPKLLRKVWIRQLPLGSPAVASELRNLARPGRLRWLSGRRSETECWDAYDVPTGCALLSLIAEPQAWQSVRYWLFDLAEEISVGIEKGSLPDRLNLDRVWISADGRAKLLDFSAPGLTKVNAASPPDALTPKEFLLQVAGSALAGRIVAGSDAVKPSRPLPLHASAFLAWLGTADEKSDVVFQLRPLLNKFSTVSREDRLALMAGSLWFPAMLTPAAMWMNSFWSKGILWAVGLFWAYAMVVVVIPCLFAALVFRGGPLLRGFSLTLVTADGRLASRRRVFWRNLLAWAPLASLNGFAGVIALRASGLGMNPRSAALWAVVCGPLILLAVLALISLRLPIRSLQDRLAGTWLVRR